MFPENVKLDAAFQSIVDTWLPLIGVVASIVGIAVANARVYDDLRHLGAPNAYLFQTVQGQIFGFSRWRQR